MTQVLADARPGSGELCVCPVFTGYQFSQSRGLRTVLETVGWEPRMRRGCLRAISAQCWESCWALADWQWSAMFVSTSWRVSVSSGLAFTSSSSISITSPELVGRCTSSRRETVPAGFRIPAGRLTPAYLAVRDECQLAGHCTRLPRVPGAASVWPDGQCGPAGPVKLASCQAGSGRVDITLPPVC